MRLARDMPARHQPVDQAGDVARRDLERVRERPLRGRSVMVQQPQQVGARHRQAFAGESLRHVLVQQHSKWGLHQVT
jgi:hypothetical protein